MADGKSNKKNKQDDEIDFLLSNVNEDSQTQPKRVKHKSEETPIASTSSYTNVSIDQENEETNEETGQQEWMSLFSLKPGNDNLLYLVLGLVALVIVATLIINFGVFVSAPVVIFVWFFGWFGVCCGGFFCISRRPKAIHICNGATVGLVFGILAMVSFSIVKDIVDRPVYNYIDVTAIPDFDAQDGSILYFANGAVDKQYSGQLSIKEDSNCNGENCALVYLCVAPIIELSQFNISASIVDYWAGCQVSQVDTDCSSQYFLNSDCYKAWSQELLSGFAYGRDGRISEGFIDASEMTAKKFGLITTNTGNQNSDGMVVLNQTNVVVVLWSSDPEQEAAVFWTLGWFLVISAPFVYCIYSILYAVLCKQRIQRSTDYEEIQ